MQNINDYSIHPKEVADKSSKIILQKSIRLALDVETEALRHNTQTFNSNKYKTIQKLSDYEELKDRARSIKEKAIENLPLLINQLTETVEARGGKTILPKTEIPGVGWFAFFADPTGNQVALFKGKDQS